MNKVLILLGKMCSGKTTLANALSSYGYKRIVTYTTRPMREGEVNHVDYHFVSDKEFKDMIDNDLLAEYTSYDAKFGHVYYGSAAEDYEKLKNEEKKVIVLNPYGLDMIIRNSIPNFSVYLDVDEDTLVKRALQRGDNPAKITRRLKADKEDFSNIKKKVDLTVDGENNTQEIISLLLNNL